jgi:hypothetical protein
LIGFALNFDKENGIRAIRKRGFKSLRLDQPSIIGSFLARGCDWVVEPAAYRSPSAPACTAGTPKASSQSSSPYGAAGFCATPGEDKYRHNTQLSYAWRVYRLPGDTLETTDQSFELAGTGNPHWDCCECLYPASVQHAGCVATGRVALLPLCLKHFHRYYDPGNFGMCRFSCKKSGRGFSPRITPAVKTLDSAQKNYPQQTGFDQMHPIQARRRL